MNGFQNNAFLLTRHRATRAEVRHLQEALQRALAGCVARDVKPEDMPLEQSPDPHVLVSPAAKENPAPKKITDAA